MSVHIPSSTATVEIASLECPRDRPRILVRSETLRKSCNKLNKQNGTLFKKKHYIKRQPIYDVRFELTFFVPLTLSRADTFSPAAPAPASLSILLMSSAPGAVLEFRRAPRPRLFASEASAFGELVESEVGAEVSRSSGGSLKAPLAEGEGRRSGA